MPEERFYTEDEANEILRAAHEEIGVTGGMSRDELLRSALEAGLPPEAIERAERRVVEQAATASSQQAFEAHSKRKFLNNFASWLGTSVLLAGINLFTGINHFWAVWPIGIWGLVVLGEAIEFYISKPWTDPEKLRKWQRDKGGKPLPPTPELDEFLDKMPLDPGTHKIEAIRAIREEFNVGLKEARDGLDGYLARRELDR